MALIGCGGWTSYYYFLIASTITQLLKEDIFGFGKSFQILNELIIAKHKFLILFINYFSEFFFGLIICLYLLYTEKAHIRKRNKYDIENNINDDDKNKDNKDNSPRKQKQIKNEMENMAKEKESEICLDDLNNNLINTDIISQRLSINSESKKEVKINNSGVGNSNNKSKTIPKNVELIHNDLLGDITESSMNNIILSSFLLILSDVIISWIFSRNEIFDYFFLKILIMTLILKYHYKEKIYSHQNFALIIILFIAGSLFVACLFETIDFSDENKTIWEAFEERHYMVFIFIIIYFCSSICSSYGIIIQKRIMDYKFVSPYKIIFFKGILGMIVSLILIIISTYVKCKEKDILPLNKAYFLNFFSETNNSSNSKNNTSPPLFECVDDYNGNIYFDNIYSYFETLKKANKTEKNLEIFFSIPIYSILHFLSNILLIFVNKHLSPIHCLIVDSLFRIIHLPILTLQNILQKIDVRNDAQGFFYEFIIQPLSTRILRFLAHCVSLIGYFIYLEIIELKFCGLNKNIRKNIRKRAKSDGRNRGVSSIKSVSSSSEDEENESNNNDK